MWYHKFESRTKSDTTEYTFYIAGRIAVEFGSELVYAICSFLYSLVYDCSINGCF
jgi:hypothetical protein